MNKARKIAIKARICSVSRVVACASFLVLTIIGVSSLVRAMSLENLANENGIPAAWAVGSLGNPDTITVPITYWDQKIDSCEDPNRQFEWVECGYWTKGVLQGLVKSTLGSDRLPVPAFSDSATAWATNHDVFTMNVTGHDPVQSGDNFYRWFHEVPGLSKQIESSITFNRTGPKTYTYGGHNIFPVDDSTTLGDKKWQGIDGQQHNFHFTAHLGFSAKIDASGNELFEFSGDDDVWVYLNNQLVLDIGGLHEAIYGWFRINEDGTLTTFVQKVNDVSERTEELTACMKNAYGDFNSCTNPFNEFLLDDHMHDVEIKTLDIGLKKDDIVNLDFFYAERSTTESNTQITISNMNWPISADSIAENKIVGQVEGTKSNIIEYNTSITNRDPSYPLDLIRMATHIVEQAKDTEDNEGFLPLSASTLEYTTTPNDPDSWQPLEITAPGNTLGDFSLKEPIRLSPYGQDGDTLYFRFYAETADSPSGKVDCLTSYYTELSGVSGVTYDQTTISYDNPTTPTEPDPIPPVDPDPEEPEKTYSVYVEYVYSDGSQALETRSLVDQPTNTDYTFITPEIPGFVPDQNMVTGTLTTEDKYHKVIYYPKEEETFYTVTIDYVYEDGDQAYESFNGTYKPNTPFSVDSPKIPGFAPNKNVIEDTVTDKNLHYTVVYRKDDTPTTPVTPPETPNVPNTPDTPETPDTPTTPENPPIGTLIPTPDNPLGDASFGYLAPLGAVAYVPNTGIVSNAVANLFDEGFAEIVLSQGFVMGVLLIFAGAFAVYFSLRDAAKVDAANKQRTINRATRKTTSSKKTTSAAKKSANTAKSTIKTPTKSTRTTTKKTTAKTAKKSR